MILSKTPFRVSFFGGGTDHYKFFKNNKASVLSCAINKHCYISAHDLPMLFKHNYRFVYSVIEEVSNLKTLKHPAFREVLNYYNFYKNLEYNYTGDLPARTGIGSSSSFIVGLINLIYKLNNKNISKKKLAIESIDIEQNVLKEVVGMQDQIAAAFGGLNKISFKKNSDFSVSKINLNKSRLLSFEKNLILAYTNQRRISSSEESKKIKKLNQNTDTLKKMELFVDDAIEILTNNKFNLNEFGLMLNDNWNLKKKLSKSVSNTNIDETYKLALNSGAIGGKVLGAGNGGFMIFFVSPSNRKILINNFKKRNIYTVNFKIDFDGSKTFKI